jgi:transposase InsO family protein
MRRREKDELIEMQVVNAIEEVRVMHPLMGLKKIYNLVLPGEVGRDRFIEIGVDNGLGIEKPRSYQRTTYSSKSAWFVNLVAGLLITGINQVWVSDITYYRVGNVFYYLTFIMDVYSRRILGYVAHHNLSAEANCRALEMSLAERAGANLNGLIHHSDRGTQYTSNKYLNILSENGIGASMCDSVYENTHIERVNGIIKNEYLNYSEIISYDDLKRKLVKTVRLYNEERPHWNLGLKIPCEYEKELADIPMNERKTMMIFSGPKKYGLQHTLFN